MEATQTYRVHRESWTRPDGGRLVRYSATGVDSHGWFQGCSWQTIGGIRSWVATARGLGFRPSLKRGSMEQSIENIENLKRDRS